MVVGEGSPRVAQNNPIKIALLGTFRVTLDGIEEENFASDKVRALLAYLAIESDRPHRRENLAGLLWPESEERAARVSLRRALSNLRHILHDTARTEPILSTTTKTVTLNSLPDLQVDVINFEERLDSASVSIQFWEETASIYRGHFLWGISIRDSSGFETWLQTTREALTRQMQDVLTRLAQLYEESEDIEQAIRHNWRKVQLEPWLEEAHYELMRLLNMAGRRSAALHQFDVCREALAEDLAVDPGPRTVRLYETIRDQPTAPPSPENRKKAEGYEFEELIGAGNFGAVYKAFQPVVDRYVAVKLILPQHSSRPEFIRRFHSEARLVASLEHPNIVPLYDFWREPEGAYLIMRWLRGGSLEEALKREPYTPEAAARLIGQIALALAAAHRQGIVHRDLKPSNILLDEESNAYLSDFGVATLMEVEGGSGSNQNRGERGFSGSPEFVSPEQVLGQTVTPASDIYSLGVLIYVLLTGQHPFPQSSDATLFDKHASESLPRVLELQPALSGEVDRVIQIATAKNPKERFPEVASLSKAFSEAVDSYSGPYPGLELKNPYKGLRPFSESDALNFFGREPLVEELLNRMDAETSTEQFLAIVGPSGIGKSSLLQAGLIPAVRQSAIEGSKQWLVTFMTPGDDPFESLQEALSEVAAYSHEIDAAIGERSILAFLNRALPSESQLLLVIDQLEDLFVRVNDEATRSRFIAALTYALRSEPSRLYVVVALRADFFDHPLQYPELGKLIQHHTHLILPLSPEDLERALVEPAVQNGVQIESGLAAEIIADTHAQPGALPLMQHSMAELFEKRSDNTITLNSYRELGGVESSLTRTAESLFGALSTSGKRAAEELFLNLVTLSQSDEVLLPQVEQSALAELPAGKSAVGDVIEAFGQARLLVFDRDPKSRQPTVQIAHEALLHGWPRLASWVEASREELATRSRLAVATEEWIQYERDPEYLITGQRLLQLNAWVEKTALPLTKEEGAFLQESSAVAMEGARKARTRRRTLIGILLGSTMVAVGLAAVAFYQRAESEKQSRFSSARELASAAVANLTVDPELSVLLAVEAVRVTQEIDGLVLPEAEHALHLAVQESRVILTIPDIGAAVAFSPDGKSIVSEGLEPSSSAQVWDVDTVDVVQTLKGHRTDINDVAYSPDGRIIATAADDRTVRIWDAASGEEILRIENLGAPVRGPDFSLDGSLLAASSDLGAVTVWDTATGENVQTITGLGADPPPSRVSLSRLGEKIAVAQTEAGIAGVWNVSTGALLHTLEGHNLGVIDVEFSPDDELLATTSFDTTARVWDAQTGESLFTLTGHTGPVTEVEFSPDGARLATASWDGSVKVWDIGSNVPVEILTLRGHQAIVESISFDPAGERLLSADVNQTAKIWDVQSPVGREWLVLPADDAWIGDIVLNQDGTRLLGGVGGGAVAMWNIETGEQLLQFMRHGPIDDPGGTSVFGIDLSPHEKILATASNDQSIILWDIRTGDKLGEFSEHANWVGDVNFSPDGESMVTASDDGSVHIIDAFTLEITKSLVEQQASVLSADFSPDGQAVVTASTDGSVRIFDVASGTELLRIGLGRIAAFAVFSPDGSRIAGASHDGTSRVWDALTGEELVALRGHSGPVETSIFSPDGSQIATGSHDGTIKLWDAQSGEELLTLIGHRDVVARLAFTPDGTRLVSSSQDGTTRVWALEIADLLSLAKQRLTRALTELECVEFLHLADCPGPP